MTGLSILTFNVWDLPVYWRQGRRSRMQKIANYLRTLKVDIICLQEVWYGDTQRLVRKTLGEKYYCTSLAHHTQGFSNGHGGLMIAAKFPLEQVAFSPFAPVNLPLSERWAHKGVLQAVVETPQGRLSIFNTHLYQPRLDVRLSQFQTVVQLLKKNLNTSACVVGDFNQEDMKTHPEFSAQLADCGFTEPLPNTSFFTHRLENSYARTWTNRVVQSAQLDYIYIHQFEQLGVQPSTYEALYHTPPLSDHDPVLLTCISL